MARIVALLLAVAAVVGADEARVVVRDGDPVAGTVVDLDRIEIATPYGIVRIPVSELAELSFTGEGVRARSAGGTFHGRIALERLRVKTRFGTVAVDTKAIERVTWARQALRSDAGPAVLLANGSLVRGRLDVTGIALDTTYGVLDIPLERIERISREGDRFRVHVDDDHVTGDLPDRDWTLTTRYGRLRFATRALRSWSGRGAPRAGETLAGGHTVVAAARFQGCTYLLVQNPKGIDWAEANGIARSLAGHLATVADAEEQAFLLELARRGGRETCWIGLSDAQQEGQWAWVTGEPVTFQAWNAGEPNDANGNEDGAEMILGRHNGAWNDIPLTQRNRGGCLIELDR